MKFKFYSNKIKFFGFKNLSSYLWKNFYFLLYSTIYYVQMLEKFLKTKTVSFHASQTYFIHLIPFSPQTEWTSTHSYLIVSITTNIEDEIKKNNNNKTQNKQSVSHLSFFVIICDGKLKYLVNFYLYTNTSVLIQTDICLSWYRDIRINYIPTSFGDLMRAIWVALFYNYGQKPH